MAKKDAKAELSPAAKKRAELIMTVTERAKPSYGRLPRKIGLLAVKSGHRNQHGNGGHASYVLRLDTEAGHFIAEHGDVWYVADTKEALTAKMEELSAATDELVWTRYIDIKYKTEADREHGDRNWLHNYSGLSVADNIGDRTVYGMSLHWEVVEYSSVIRTAGKPDRYMCRSVDDYGEANSDEDFCTKLPDGLVEYTADRITALTAILAGLKALDAKFRNLLGGKAVAAHLDAIAGGPFLLIEGDDE